MLDIREPRARPDARLLEVRFRGTVCPTDLARAVREVRTRTHERGPGSLVVDFGHASSPSPDALPDDLRDRLRHPDWLRGVERIALLADATRRDRLARVEGVFVDGPPAFVRAFAARTARARTARVRTFAERDETGAWAWLGVAPGDPPRRLP